MPLNVFAESGGWALLLILLAFLGLFVAAIVGVLLVLKKSVSPFWGLLPIAMMMVVVVMMDPLGEMQILEALSSASVETKQIMLAVVVSRSIQIFVLLAWLVPLPALFFGGMCAVAGIRGPKRSVVAPIFMGLGVAGVIIMSLVGTLWSGSPVEAIVKAGLFFLSGLFAVLSVVGAGTKSTERLAGVGAVVAFGLLVSAVHVGMLSWLYMDAFQAVAFAPAHLKHEILQAGLDLTLPMRQMTIGGMALCGLMSMLATFRVLGDVRQTAGAFACLTLFCLGPLLLWADPLGLLTLLQGGLL